MQGVVLDQNSNPIPEASIRVVELNNVGTSSNFDGKFSIKLPKGKYTLQTSFIGFKTRLTSINTIVSSSFITIVLTESVEQLNDVIVKGKTEAQMIKEQAFEVEVLETKGLKNISVDINSLLNTVPGVVVRESGGLGSNFNFSLNGFSGNQVKFFIDGIPQDNLGTSLTFNNFPATLIERAELYKGVVPIYLGADALGGAVNIITNQKKQTFLDISYDVGSFNTHRAALNGSYFSKSGLAFKVISFFNYSDNDYTINQIDPKEEGIVVRDPLLGNPVDTLSSAKRFHDAYQSQMVQARLGLVDKIFADELFLGVTASSNNNEIQHGILPRTPFGEVKTEESVVSGSLIFKKDSVINLPLKLRIYGEIAEISSKVIDTFSNNYNWQGEIVERNDQTRGERGGDKTLFTFDDQRYLVNTSLQHTLDSHKTLYFNYTKNYLRRKGNDSFSTLRSPFEDPHIIDKNIFGLAFKVEALQKRWETTLFSKLFLASVAGLIEDEFDPNEATRFSNYKNTSQEWGHGIASSFEVYRNLKAKVSYEKTFRIPEGYELFGDGLLLKSNPFLMPEESQNINVGFLWGSTLGSFQIDADVNTFLRETKNLFFLLPEGVTARYINLAETRNTGIEGEVSIQHDNFYLSINSTYQYIIDAIQDVRVANRPYFFGNFRAGYTFQNLFPKKSRLSVSWNSLFTERFPFQSFTDGNPEDRFIVPQQLSHNLQLGYSIEDKYNISIQARNITDARVFDNIAVQKPGRAFFVKLRYFLKNK
ncbi:TonB-dependent receptor [Aquimarina gracilis]|uniref:TonB-dependent receptor n=1 Tax=Aquimarina gracilis TaxID=874422 RepID=A0ABU5ZRL7_9FLAO|nr:TonB-dependent receptor [Aquimarina gracilis]MEB3343891.1 TonB-dependent receptor [Aquimarina gracilis]